MGPVGSLRAFAIPIPSGKVLPDLPANGLRTEKDVLDLEGAQIVDYAGMAVVGSSSGRSPRARILRFTPSPEPPSSVTSTGSR